MKDRVTEWLKLAEQARDIANGMRDPTSKKAMMEIAAAYDRLATVVTDRQRAADSASD